MVRIVVQGPGGVTISYRLDREWLTLGRDEMSDVVLSGRRVSRHHSELRREESGWVLLDSDSRNGTRLNGSRVTGPVRLNSGDTIGIGHHTLEFEEVDPADVVPQAETDASISVGAAPRRVAEPSATLVGSSPAMRFLRKTVDRIAMTDATVLITGENGTGKELVARRIHGRSQRAGGPFEVINCPALSSSLLETELFGIEARVASSVDRRVGKLELAHGGTVFLDEVADLQMPAQAALLRFLQERSIQRVGGRKEIQLDVRVVAATNRDLREAIGAGTFREDLYHRLEVIALKVPTLRERREDIRPLAEHFLQSGDRAPKAISDEVLSLFARYSFPGNVRQLQNVIESSRIMAEGSLIEPRHLPSALLDGSSSSGTATENHGLRQAARPVVSLEPAAVERPRLGPQSDDAPGADLLLRFQAGELTWPDVRSRFLDKDLSRPELRGFIRGVYRIEGGSYRRTAEKLGVGDDYRKLLDFLRYHRLRVTDELFD